MSQPLGWVRAPLGDLIDAIEAGKNLRCEERPPEPHEAGIIKISAVTWGWFNPKEAKTAPRNVHLPSDTLIRDGDLLISRANTLELVGATVIVERAPANLHLSDKVLRIRTAPDIAQWLNRYLRSMDGRNEIERRATGNQLSMRNIGQDAIRQIHVPIPPLPEQRRIVAKLDCLFARTKAARDELAHIPLLIEHYKQAILARGFKRAAVQAAINAELGSIAREVRNGLSRRPENYPPGVPILKISAVRSMAVRLNEMRYYVLETGEDVSRYHLQSGDLLFTRYNGNPALVANCGMVKQVTEDTIYPDKLIRVRLDTSTVDPNFIEFVMASPQIRNALSPCIKSAAGQHGISGADLKRIILPLPSIYAQRRIVETLKVELGWLATVEAEAGTATRLMDHLDRGLLAKAFRGKLVPQDPDDERAETLLERIRAARAGPPRVRRGRRPSTMDVA